KVNSVPSSFHDVAVYRPWVWVPRLNCPTSCLYMIRLLKGCIGGCKAARVDSSRIDMLAGLSKCDSLRMPPCFWASAGPPAAIAISTAAMPPTVRDFLSIRASPLLFAQLFVEPDVFHAPLVVDAVGHDRQPFDPGLPAGVADRIKQHRPHRRFRQLALDLPDDVLALYRISLHRLL